VLLRLLPKLKRLERGCWLAGPNSISIFFFLLACTRPHGVTSALDRDDCARP